jgi:hypothetical protein
MRDSEIPWSKDDLPELWELAVVDRAIKAFPISDFPVRQTSLKA